MNGFLNGLICAGCEGGFNWYGFLIGSGMVVCIVIAYFLSVKRGYDRDLVFDICIVCIPTSIVGARLYYVIFDIIGSGNSWTFKEVLGIGSGGLSGLAIYGGLIGAVTGGLIVHLLKRNKPPEKRATFLQMADLAFTVIILGQAIGRWGNFANQEAYGNEVTNTALQHFPFAVYIDAIGQWRQATFFYESFFNTLGFLLLLWIYGGKRKSFDGFSLCIYGIWYGVVRFFIEGLRADSLYLIPNVLRVSQLVSALIAIAGAAGILVHVYRARSHGKKPFLFIDKDKLDDTFRGYEHSILSHPNVYVKEEKKKGFLARLFAKTEPTPELDEQAPEDALADDAANATPSDAAPNEADDEKSHNEVNNEENEERHNEVNNERMRYADFDDRDPYGLMDEIRAQENSTDSEKGSNRDE